MACRNAGFSPNSKAILNIQAAILVLLLFVVITFNITAIFITVKTLQKCLISKMFGSSYVGNIMAACSLFGGDLYTLFKWDALYDCTATWDKHFFLYLGLTVNMTVLAVNTYLRTSNIKSTSRRHSSCSRGFWSLKMPIMLWIFSSIVALGSVFLEMSFENNFTEVSLVLVTPFFITVLVLNVQLSHFLRKQKKHTANLSAQPTSSYANIHSAENVVCRIVRFQVSAYIVWILVVSFIKNFESERRIYAMFIWSSRVSFVLSFCCECVVLIVTHWVKSKKCLMKVFNCSTKRKRKRSLETTELKVGQLSSTVGIELTDLSTVSTAQTSPS